MKEITIDGRHLSYPGTGLALVTSELINEFQKLGHAKFISVFLDRKVNLEDHGLDKTDINWIYIDLESQFSGFVKWAAKVVAVPDHIERIGWSRAILREIRTSFRKSTHFIPYLYNYGNLDQNVVLIPDLIYRLISPEVSRNPSRSWLWNLRHRLPLRHWFRLWEERRAAKSNKLVVYSKFVRNCVSKNFGVPSERIHLIYLAAPRWIIKEGRKEDFSAIRLKHQLPERFVLYVGGFSERKNIPMLLNACGAIHRADPTFKCVFVGMKDFLETSIGSLVRDAMRDKSIAAAAVPTGPLENDDLAALYHLADFTVYPSLSEGFGLPLLEAAAAEKLCLCGDNSSMPEIQPNPAYRVDSLDEDAWKFKILHFWQSPRETVQAGKESKELVKNYSWQKSAESLWQVLQS